MGREEEMEEGRKGCREGGEGRRRGGRKKGGRDERERR